MRWQEGNCANCALCKRPLRRIIVWRRRPEAVALFGRNGAVEVLHMRMSCDGKKTITPIVHCTSALFGESFFERGVWRPSHFSGGMVRSKFCTCVCHAMARRRLRQLYIVQAPCSATHFFERGVWVPSHFSGGMVRICSSRRRFSSMGVGAPVRRSCAF